MNLPRPYWGHSALSTQGVLHHSCIDVGCRVKLVVLLYLLKKELFLFCQLPPKPVAKLVAV
jgi:hypothetical protein